MSVSFDDNRDVDNRERNDKVRRTVRGVDAGGRKKSHTVGSGQGHKPELVHKLEG